MPYLEVGNHCIQFIHIPKTGGTSVEHWLAQHGVIRMLAGNPRPPFNSSPQHMTWRDIQFLLNNKEWNYSFSIVRNPYERVESEFCFRHKSQLTKGLQTLNFGTWLEQQLDKVSQKPYHLDNHMRPQHEFLAKSVDVFRFEDGLEAILNEVAKRAKLPEPEEIPHVNTREGKPSFDWSAQLLEKFNEYYAKDFEKLGYKKQEIEVIQLGELRGH